MTCRTSQVIVKAVSLPLVQFREAGIQEEVELKELVGKLLEGLRQLSVYSQTGAGRAALPAHVDARELVRSVMRNRQTLCTLAQQAVLESMVKSSTVSPEVPTLHYHPATLVHP